LRLFPCMCCHGSVCSLLQKNACRAASGCAIFDNGGAIFFNDRSRAGNASLVNLAIFGSLGVGNIQFYDNSTADNATVMNDGFVFFYGSATAGNAAFIGGETSGLVNFSEFSTAGNGVFTTSPNGSVDLAKNAMQFSGTSTAGNATVIIEGGSVAGAGANVLTFVDDASADNGNFTINGASASGADGGIAICDDTSHGGNATFTINGGATSGAGGGKVIFGDTVSGPEASHAENATLTANLGASIMFLGDSTGDAAQIRVFGSGQVDVSDRSSPSITFGSIEGSGIILLGGSILEVGGNNLSTEFTGTIADGGSGGGRRGSLVKNGTGNLSLWNASTYTGGTIVNDGILLANGLAGSCTGKGPVVVNAGTFGGGGRVAGPVKIGTGSGSGAILAPGTLGVIPGAFTIQKNLQLLADATLKILMESENHTTDVVAAKGIRSETRKSSLTIAAQPCFHKGRS
jgi:autotransporter-associated beta strand protein